MCAPVFKECRKGIFLLRNATSTWPHLVARSMGVSL